MIYCKINLITVNFMFKTIFEGFFGPMCCVIGLSFVTCQMPYMGVSLLVTAIACFGATAGSGNLVMINEVYFQLSFFIHYYSLYSSIPLFRYRICCFV